MEDMSEWERQRREVNTYNLFYSCLTARASPSLTSDGWCLPVMFAEFEDNRNDIKANPDFVLYDGDICLLVELKSGNNIEERHIQQMERCNELSIEAVENELRNAQIQEDTVYDGTIHTVDACIVYQDMHEEFIENCRYEWDNCQERLEELEKHTAILTQDYGGKLRRIAGEFESGRLQRIFDEGIELPQNPKRELMVSENMDKEILAVAICEIWGEKVVDHKNPIKTNVNEIRDHFAPRYNLPPHRVNRVLYFLDKIGACDYIEDLTYEFSRDHLTEVLQIEESMRNAGVEDVLDGETKEHLQEQDQTTLDTNFNNTREEGLANGGQKDDEETDSSHNIENRENENAESS
jgi:hypothetical protein